MTPGRDPKQEPAHDVLAAEAFAVPAPDPRLRRPRPLVVPDDPSGISEPHDILAAEEFAMPAADGEADRTSLARGAESPWLSALGAAAALLALLGLRRRRRVT
jgi:LPXTG-motif cell wall-anchored protein